MLLSVCVITYNHAAYIRQAIDSILAQVTDFAFEIIVGEDASTDATAVILGEIASEHADMIKVAHHHINLGSQQNLINTLERCSGEYVAFLEGDDFWIEPSKLQQQVDFLERHPDASFCFHRSRSLDESCKFADFVVPSSDPPSLSCIDLLLGSTNPVALGSVVARKGWLQDLPPWFADLKLGDWPLCLKLAQRGNIGYIPKEMSRYRLHPGGLWSQLPAHLKVVYTIQMMLKMSSALDAEHTIVLRQQAIMLADWWSGELIQNASVLLREVVIKAAEMQDTELFAFLFLRTAIRAREIHTGRQWFEHQWRRREAIFALSRRDEDDVETPPASI